MEIALKWPQMVNSYGGCGLGNGHMGCDHWTGQVLVALSRQLQRFPINAADILYRGKDEPSQVLITFLMAPI